MIPGSTSYRPPDFPEGWCGLWQDPTGKVMFIERVQGRHLALSFSPGLKHPFFPLHDGPNKLTSRLSGIYAPDDNGAPLLRIEMGEPGFGPFYDVHFIFGEGDRLRPAESWDMVSGVIARPKLALGPTFEAEDNTLVSWAYPLANYWKMDENAAQFKSFHGW